MVPSSPAAAPGVQLRLARGLALLGAILVLEAAACSDDAASSAQTDHPDVTSDINRQRPEADSGDAAATDTAAGDTNAVGQSDRAAERDPSPLEDPSADQPAEDLPRSDGPLPPVADAGEDIATPAGEPVGLDGSASFDPDGTVVAWAWSFGDGSEDDGDAVFHTYAAAGEYVATLTVTDDADLTDSADGTVEAWLWEFPDDSTQETPIATYTFTAPGEPEVLLTVTDDDGLTASTSFKVGVEPGAGGVDLSGIWDLDPDPDSGEGWSRLSYGCGCVAEDLCLVSFDFAAVELVQDLGDLDACQEPTGMPCAAGSTQPGRMSGTVDGEPLTFSIANIYPGGPGGCDETYALEGEVVGDDELRGTFSASYVGGACGTADCHSQEWQVRALRRAE